mmetsp:Transcript_27551/g.43050  ORF Transcript_27551/g.43050 Transcript_27551/m.43050 type:complete len:107 (+) Transcript_27551:71-391(+)
MIYLDKESPSTIPIEAVKKSSDSVHTFTQSLFTRPCTGSLNPTHGLNNNKVRIQPEKSAPHLLSATESNKARPPGPVSATACMNSSLSNLTKFSLYSAESFSHVLM